MVRAVPPGTPAGRSAPWVEPWVIWRDERVALPRRWDAEVRHPEVPWNVVLTVVVESGRLACEHIAVSRRPGGPPVTSTALRNLPVHTLLVASAQGLVQVQDPAEDDDAVLSARMRARPPGWAAEDVAQHAEAIARLPESTRLPVLGHAEDIAHLPEAVRARLQMVDPGVYSDPPIPAAALKATRDLEQPERRPRANDKDALLSEVVGIYREALTGTWPDRAPREAVKLELERRGLIYSRTYVAKLLVEARKKGMLGPAHVGRAGERSTPAVTVDHDKKARKR